MYCYLQVHKNEILSIVAKSRLMFAWLWGAEERIIKGQEIFFGGVGTWWICSLYWVWCWFHCHMHVLTENAMAPLSSTLAWKIPWMEEPGRLQSMGLLRVGQDWATSLSLFTFMHWRRKWQPTPVFLPGESQGWRSLVGCHLWGRTESDTTEET